MSDGKTARPRFAIYYAPDADEPVWALGSAWLGRNAETGAVLSQPPVAGLSAERLVEITRGPWFYGFHATLKPPFHLAPAMSHDRIEQTILAFTAARRAFRLPPLLLTEMAGFIALTLSEECLLLHGLADDCVRIFDPFRAPMDAEQRTRRAAGGLTARQRQLLERWGYPFVMDEWRFHMTLTSQVDNHDRALLLRCLESLFTPQVRKPLQISGLSLFCQEHPLKPFRLIRRYRFGG